MITTFLRLQVGVYGYAVYAASKFALRGLAECLQQELVDRNIRLSLVYPPDTMTPGYLEGALMLLSDTVWMCEWAMNFIPLPCKGLLILTVQSGRKSHMHFLILLYRLLIWLLLPGRLPKLRG